MKNANGTQQFLQIIDDLSVAVIVIRCRDDVILYTNHRVSCDIEKEITEIIDHDYHEVFWPDFARVLDSELPQLTSQTESDTFIYYWAEHTIWEQISVAFSKWSDETPVLVLSITNITAIAQEMYRAESMAYVNGTLNLPNGQKLERDINTLADTTPFSLIYVQLERYNDLVKLFGCDTGIELLTGIRDWFLATEKPNVRLYSMYCGFALLGPTRTLESSKNRASEIIDRFHGSWLVHSGETALHLYCPVQVGLVSGKYIRNEMRSLLLRTLAAPKTAGGYSVFNELTDRQETQRLKLQELLVNCVRDNMNGFEVYYQPIISTADGRLCGLESLCRFRTPGGIPISPAVFIPLAEQLGLIRQLDAWVRDTAMTQCLECGLITDDFFLNINLSPVHPLDDDFVIDLLAAIGRLGFPPQSLNLEITESSRVEFSDIGIENIKRIKNQGILISLDDFGTGYSSFENLMKIPASFLKMEKLFIDDILDSDFKQLLIQTLLSVTRHLGMKLIAEGVETKEQYEYLRSLGVDYIQGNYFSPPRPMADLTLPDPSLPHLA